MGTNGKSGKFLYYSCNSRVMKGRTTCDASSISARKLETFVMDRIRENILTEECLGQLVRLANEELGVNRRRAEQKLERLERESRSVQKKLERLYAALEGGKVDIDDLAPRLKELRAEQRELREKTDEALDDINQAGHEPLDVVAMEKYVAELQGLLQSATFQESKAFLASFVRRVEFDKQQVRIEYTVPVALENGLTDTTEVRNVGKAGTPGRTRTAGTRFRKPLLYPLSYRGQSSHGQLCHYSAVLSNSPEAWESGCRSVHSSASVSHLSRRSSMSRKL